MPCFRPVPGWRSKLVNASTGKRSIVYRPSEANALSNGFLDTIERPCGQCRYCRAERARQWGMRSVLESTLYEFNCFITLTYKEEHLPARGFLDYQAPVEFMRRLRKRHGEGIRSYGCAEYGSKGTRPHYHLCIFNHDFLDKKEIRSKGRDALYESADLSDLWPYGFSSLGTLTFESAAYVASYCTKKLTGKMSAVYEEINWDTGEIFTRPFERSVSVSRMPGIGRPWYDLHGAFVRRHDFVIVSGRKMRPPKYFDLLCEREFNDDFIVMKEKRRKIGDEMMKKMEDEDMKNCKRIIDSDGNKDYSKWPVPRLYVMEMVEELKARHFKRNLEDE